MKQINIEERRNWIRRVAGRNYSFRLLTTGIKNSLQPDLVLMECTLVFLYAMENVSPRFRKLGITFLEKKREEIRRVFSLLPKQMDVVIIKNWPVFLELVKQMIEKGAIQNYTPNQLAEIIYRTCKTGYTKRTILNKIKELFE